MERKVSAPQTQTGVYVCTCSKHHIEYILLSMYFSVTVIVEVLQLKKNSLCNLLDS